MSGFFNNLFKPLAAAKPLKFFIDVSKHNGVIDWPAVAKHTPKVDAAIIKATEGQDFIDIKFLRNAQGAKAAGLQVGYYHFASLNTANVNTDAREEALDFIAAMKTAPKADLPPVLDIEENKAKLPDPTVVAWIQEFLRTMASNGYPDVIIYSYTPFLDQVLPAGHPFGKLKLWVAGYVPKERLKIPKGWTAYWAWQYSSTGRISGINGNVDLNTTEP